MTEISAHNLSADELAALMHFYAEAGIDWLVEDQAIDRFAEFAAINNARKVQAPVAAGREATAEGALVERTGRTLPGREAPRPAIQPVIAIPDAEAVETARKLAASATSVDALIQAVGGFGGCNLRNSARNTVFASGNLSARIAVIGGVPGADDDREGAPFSGQTGAMLGRMLTGIGLRAEDLLIFNLIPWRTPGDRQPTRHEVDICLPFGLRLLEIVKPEAVLAFGNFPARVLAANPKGSIHSLRGKWFEISAGDTKIPALATFHPEELIAAPTCKRMAWQDILQFRAGFDAGDQQSR